MESYYLEKSGVTLELEDSTQLHQFTPSTMVVGAPYHDWWASTVCATMLSPTSGFGHHFHHICCCNVVWRLTVLGASGMYDNMLTGALDELRVWDTVMSDEEVMALNKDGAAGMS